MERGVKRGATQNFAFPGHLQESVDERGKNLLFDANE